MVCFVFVDRFLIEMRVLGVVEEIVLYIVLVVFDWVCIFDVVIVKLVVIVMVDRCKKFLGSIEILRVNGFFVVGSSFGRLFVCFGM